MLYNDGYHGTGTADDMAIGERHTLAQHGIVILAVTFQRMLPEGASLKEGLLDVNVRVSTRGMWTKENALLEKIEKACKDKCAMMRMDMPYVASAFLFKWVLFGGTSTSSKA
jgi:mRNA degradation ribonuclease J1/J2